MKPEARVIDATSTLTGEEIGMTIDQDALAHIMSVLTDLYSDPETAVIREYSTNALDSHIEAGVTRPIEVTTPSSLSPFFRVKDFGLGLDVEDIRNIYSRYGTSSKRNSDDVVGMLGLGCKSALTYTDQFTLTGIKNGIATQVSVSRNEDGGGSMTIVNEYATDEPSGVEVIVPVKGYNSFETKANYFFSFWKPGTVLVNGVEPKGLAGLKISDKFFLADNLDHAVVVMGNVPYPVSDGTLPTFQGYNNSARVYTREALVAFVEIGQVQFTPSREALQMTVKTKNTLEELRKEYIEARDIALLKLVNDAPSKPEAIKIGLKTRAFNSKLKLSYQGTDIPEVLTAPDKKHFLSATGKKGWGKCYHNERNFDLIAWSKAMWITGYTEEGFTPYKRKKLDQWAAEKQIQNDNIYIIVNKIPKEVKSWIDPSMIHPWAEIQAQKIAKNAPLQNGKLSGSYPAFALGTRLSILASDIDTTKPIYWTNSNCFYLALHESLGIDSTLVSLPANRVAKFKRDFPTALLYSDALKVKAETWAKNLTEVDKLIIGINENRYSIPDPLQSCDYKLIDDPKLSQLIQLSTSKSPHIEKYRQYKNFIEIPDIDGKLSKTLDKYILLTKMNFYGRMTEDLKNHVYTYVNAVYSADKEKN